MMIHYNSLSASDDQADSALSVPQGVQDQASLDVSAVNVVHPQDAVVHLLSRAR